MARASVASLNEYLLVHNEDNMPFELASDGSTSEMDVDKRPSADLLAVPKRSLNVWKLAAVAYVTVCGGPFGLEQSVQSAGAKWTIIACVLLAFLWAMPQVSWSRSNLPPLSSSFAS